MINGEINADGQANMPEVKRITPRMTQVKKTGLSEFLVKMKGTGGEITCVWSGKTQKFGDLNGLLKFIDQQCDAVWYPQSQRKLRDWNE